MVQSTTETSGIQNFIFVAQESSVDLILDSGNTGKELERLNANSFYLELTHHILASEEEKSEEEVHSFQLAKLVRNFRASNFNNAILLENVLLKVNFKAFFNSLNLFAKSARTHLVIQVFTI
jgi:hypothetical protein